MKTLLLAAMLLSQRPVSPGLQTGTITGRLLTVDGSPAVKTRVSATPVPESSGQDRPTLMTLAETDADGNYRLADVPVGRYYIVAASWIRPRTTRAAEIHRRRRP